MSKRGDSEFLSDIQEAVRRIGIYAKGIDYENFLEDIKTQDSVIRNLEIIGEAVKNISDDFKDKHPQILWKDWAGVRDKLIHHYFGVNLEVVWYIIQDDLPPLKEEVRRILEQKKIH